MGYDDNLGLPDDFSASIGCEIQAYHDLNEMIQAFEQGSLAAMFIPAGTLPYLKNYELLAQSLFGPQQKIVLQTNFVTVKEISISQIPQMKIGRVNQFCTTSFWAPQIYLMQFLPQNTALTFVNTNGFPDMLHKTAEEIVDCSMVWDIIMQQHPEDTDKVHELFHLANLPSPVIVGPVGGGAGVKEKLDRYISQDSRSFFRGFKAPDLGAIGEFLLAIKKAEQHFKIIT